MKIGRPSAIRAERARRRPAGLFSRRRA